MVCRLPPILSASQPPLIRFDRDTGPPAPRAPPATALPEAPLPPALLIPSSGWSSLSPSCSSSSGDRESDAAAVRSTPCTSIHEVGERRREVQKRKGRRKRNDEINGTGVPLSSGRGHPHWRGRGGIFRAESTYTGKNRGSRPMCAGSNHGRL
jgi:hypothetical protein